MEYSTRARRSRGLTWRVALLGFPLLLAIWIGLSVYHGYVQYGQRLAEIDRAYRMLTAGQDLFGRLRDTETGQRGFLLTGRQEYLAPYHTGQEGIDRDFVGLADLAGDLPRGKQQLAEVQTLILAKRAEMDETIDLYRTRGLQAAVEIVETDRGRQLMDQIRAQLNALLTDCLRRLVAQREAGNAALLRASLITGLGSAVLFIMLAFAAVIIDRDAKKQWRDAAHISQLNQTLEKKIQERTQLLEESNRELETFCYSVSHDLRAPLRSVEGFSKILVRDYPGRALDDRGLDLMRRMSASTVRMGQLIDDLLNLSRISRGALEPRTVDLSTLAAAVAGELESGEPERNVEVHIQPGLTATGDPWLLRVAVENLLGNAWKFTRQAPAPRLEIGQVQTGEETAYYVRDNGVGFDMAHAEQLFVPFQRLHRASEFEGTGIGLATVHRVIQRHGGRIWAESVPGEGASFFFTLGGLTVDHERKAIGAPQGTDSVSGG